MKMESMNVLPCTILSFLLSAGASLAQSDEEMLTGIVKTIRRQYSIAGQFCLAAVIPPNLNTLYQVFEHNSFEDVQETIGDNDSPNNNRGVYVGYGVIVARPTLSADGRSGQHAERRVLQTLRELVENPNEFPKSQGNSLLIYSFLSACDTCTSRDHPSSIIRDLQRIVQTYTTSVFVFKKIFQPRINIVFTENDLTNSLYSLDEAIGGLANIFRCDPTCYRCIDRQTNAVSRYCIANDA
ncbi:unnamed protein product [Oreochromis niloticus]|nr:unnamed protein product [Mustela putorius furo]